MSFSCRSLASKVDLQLCIYIFCLLLPFLLSPLAASDYKESRCGYVLLIVATYWLLEPVPIAATALIPIVLFPMLGVISSAEVCGSYMKEVLIIFIGSLVVAFSIEECNLHKRIALKLLLLIGTKIQWLLFGFMVTTALLSMFITNTATTAMMIPIALAVVGEISRSDDIEMKNNDVTQTESKVVEDPVTGVKNTKMPGSSPSTLKTTFLVSICYSANIGGTGTLTGTGTNLILKGFLEDLHPDSEEITFATWMMYNVPGVILCIAISWFFLWMFYAKFSSDDHKLPSEEKIKHIISKQYAALGPISAREVQVIVFFTTVLLLWCSRDPKFVTGWSEVIGFDTKIGNSAPAIGIAFLMFLLPATPGDLKGPRILAWKTAQAKIPWGLFILVGGGFAIADAAKKSGLSVLMGTKLSALSVLPPEAIVAIMCFTSTMMTEILTNSSTITLMLPVLHQMAISLHVNPLFLLLPVTVCASYAFMLPIATAPNAIVFESGNMRTLDMAKPGIVMNLICCGIQLFMINTLGTVMFDLHTFPSWANSTRSPLSVMATESFNISSFENSTVSSY